MTTPDNLLTRLIVVAACVLATVWTLRACSPSSAEEGPVSLTPAAIAAAPAHVPARWSGNSTEIIESSDWLLLIHGGAGVISPDAMTAELAGQYRAGLQDALNQAGAVLSSGGSAMDAVELAVVLLEDNPLFNAGRGAVLNAEGRHELDASIMDGRSRQAGAVAGVTSVKNPIRAARAVLEHTPHVMMASDGADDFAFEHGLDVVANDYFTTEQRRADLNRVLAKRGGKRDKRGTVGAVAIDVFGDVAAATSTGGMTGKLPGRVGDSPIIGAGNYADNFSCAVSTTGHGEYFMRLGAAQRICTMIEFSNISPSQAGESVLSEVADLGGDGGAIILAPGRGGAFVFNTPGMFRGFISANGEIGTAIYARSGVH